MEHITHNENINSLRVPRYALRVYMKKIWQTDENLHPLVEKYTVGEDYKLDQTLIPYDIKASLAHAEMLFEKEILTKDEFEQTKKGLNEILDLWKKGEFTIKMEQEDGHTAIEQYLTEKYGDVGKKIHTGRSRNDQALVMIRLFIVDNLTKLEKLQNNLTKTFSQKIEKTKNIGMPGYTHTQKAMPTTVDIWLGSYLAALKDFEISLKTVKNLVDQNPLGSASGFGIENFPIDKTITTKLLNFQKVQENPMYCGFSRGYFENIVLQTLSQPMIIFGRFASDMILFTTTEFNFFSLPNNFVTGSSIMPQKKNYDLFEIMRANTKVFIAYQNQIQETILSLGSGYYRDLQLTKKPLLRAVDLCLTSFELMDEVIKNLKIHEDVLKEAMTPDIYITNKIYELVKEGKSFREAYIEIKKGI